MNWSKAKCFSICSCSEKAPGMRQRVALTPAKTAQFYRAVIAGSGTTVSTSVFFYGLSNPLARAMVITPSRKGGDSGTVADDDIAATCLRDFDSENPRNNPHAHAWRLGVGAEPPCVSMRVDVRVGKRDDRDILRVNSRLATTPVFSSSREWGSIGDRIGFQEWPVLASTGPHATTKDSCLTARSRVIIIQAAYR